MVRPYLELGHVAGGHPLQLRPAHGTGCDLDRGGRRQIRVARERLRPFELLGRGLLGEDLEVRSLIPDDFWLEVGAVFGTC